MSKYGDYLYNSLPKIYRVKDSEVDFTLKKFLHALGDGLEEVHEEVLNLLTLIDVEKMDSKFLPFYASMFGVTYNYDVPEAFQRKYLANLVDIMKRKGTREVIEFTAREITGMEANILEGHYRGFRTWGTNPHEEKLHGYEMPKTYNNKREDVPFRFVGGTTTQRGTVIVNLTTDKETSDLYLNHHIVSRYLKDLVQPYVNLIFRITGMQDSDTIENTKGLVSDHEVLEVDIEKIISNVQEGSCYDIIKTKDGNDTQTTIVHEEFFDDEMSEVYTETYKVNATYVDNTNVSQETFNDTYTKNITVSEKMVLPVESSTKVGTVTQEYLEDGITTT